MTKGVVTERLGPFVRVGGARSLATLRSALADRLVHYRIDDLDGAAIRLSAPRQFTQEISSFIEPLQDDEAEEAFGGINYLSRLGDDIENWAIFERQRMHARSPVLTVERSALDPEDGDLQAALQLLGLKVV